MTSTTDTTQFGEPRTATPALYAYLGADQRPTTLPTGTIDMGDRSYIPALGRFLQTDPVPGGSANAYDYAGQDPVDNTDLSGDWYDTPYTPVFDPSVFAAGQAWATQAANAYAAAQARALAASEAAQQAAQATQAAQQPAGQTQQSGGDQPFDDSDWQRHLIVYGGFRGNCANAQNRNQCKKNSHKPAPSNGKSCSSVGGLAGGILGGALGGAIGGWIGGPPGASVGITIGSGVGAQMGSETCD